MGIIDTILKAVIGQDNSNNTKPASNSNTNTAKASAPVQSKPSVQTSSDVIASGDKAAKPCIRVEQEYGDFRYFFELSRDFVEFNSHSEADPSYQYEPDNDSDFTSYDQTRPTFCICPDDDIYDACEAVENGEEPSCGFNIAQCNKKPFLFSTTFTKYGMIYYAYGFASDSAREKEMICVTYLPDVKGTALESKLKAALDHAVATYEESNL